MSRDGIDGDDMDLVEVCDQALGAACSGLMHTAEHAALELRQYRNVYDVNGEYEFPTGGVEPCPGLAARTLEQAIVTSAGDDPPARMVRSARASC